MSFGSFLKETFTIATIVAPVCPKCGSNITGHMINGSHNTNIEAKRKFHLRLGEYIKLNLSHGQIYGSPNVFCVNCGNEWLSDDIEYKHFSRAELKQHKKNIRIIDKNNSALMFAYMNDLPYSDYNEYEEYKKKRASGQLQPGEYNFDDDDEDESYYENERESLGKKVGKRFLSDYVLSPTVGVLSDLFPSGDKKIPANMADNSSDNYDDIGENISSEEYNEFYDEDYDIDDEEE